MAGLPLAVRVNPKQRDFSIDTDRGIWVWKRRFSYKDFNAASTTSNVDITFPGGVRLLAARMALITPFSGGSVSAATFSLGTTGSAATYLGATNVFTGATSGGAVTAAAGAGLGAFISTDATPTVVGTLRAQILTTTANASTLTAGTLVVFLDIMAYSVTTT